MVRSSSNLNRVQNLYRVSWVAVGGVGKGRKGRELSRVTWDFFLGGKLRGLVGFPVQGPQGLVGFCAQGLVGFCSLTLGQAQGLVALVLGSRQGQGVFSPLAPFTLEATLIDTLRCLGERSRGLNPTQRTERN